MLCEPSTLASVPRLIAETLERDYDVDPAPVFEILGVKPADRTKPGARVPFFKMNKVWEWAVEATGDPMFGIRVGRNVTPSDFYVLGHAWIASATLLGAMKRLCRYTKVLSTATRPMHIERSEDSIALVEAFAKGRPVPHKAARDGGYAALLKLCEIAGRHPVYPVSVELSMPLTETSVAYDALFRCPIVYGTASDKLFFSVAEMEEPLTGWIPDVLEATERIAERYLESLGNTDKVATEVRQLLVQLLPAGNTDQDTIAKRLYRSRSTLQRQLSAEGTNYRDLLESTRRRLAEEYLRDSEYTQAQIAFMTGFADQSNFSRAFRRWTGMSPGQFRSAA